MFISVSSSLGNTVWYCGTKGSLKSPFPYEKNQQPPCPVVKKRVRPAPCNRSTPPSNFLAAKKGDVAALARSHMNGLQPFESTIEQTTETMPPSHKTVTAAGIGQMKLQAYESCYTTETRLILCTITFPFFWNLFIFSFVLS